MLGNHHENRVTTASLVAAIYLSGFIDLHIENLHSKPTLFECGVSLPSLLCLDMYDMEGRYCYKHTM